METPPTSSLDRTTATEANRSRWLGVLQRYSGYLVIGEVVIVAIVGYWLFIAPRVATLLERNDVARAAEMEAQARIATLDRQAEEMREIITRYDAISTTDMQAIAAMLPTGAHLEELFVQLDAMVKQNGLLLTSIALQDTTASAQAQKRSRLDIAERAPSVSDEPSELVETVLTIHISGASYPALKNMLSALENNLRIINVTEIAYDPAREAAEITASVYHLVATP